MRRFLLTHAIDHWADSQPDQQAVVIGEKTLTYAQLVARADRLAVCLADQGVGRGDRVGIYLNKSLESIISVYGIMKCGAAYVPLDPFAPSARLRYVIDDCGIRVLITETGKTATVEEWVNQSNGLECVIGVPRLSGANVRTLTWEDVEQHAAAGRPPMDVTESDLAYILYTSGSTGTPKGIMHSHRSGLSFAEWAVDTYELWPDDRLSNHAPLHFDLSTFDIFASHIAGATTVLIPEAITKFPASLSQLIQDQSITVWYSVPFALIQLSQRGRIDARDFSKLRWILFAGEPFPTKHLKLLMAQVPHARYSNLYGPTETNVCTYYHVPSLGEDEDSPIPIGVPCSNVEAMIVDDAGALVADGSAGELLIRGGVVMRGYWGQPERTEKGFFRRQLLPGYEDVFYRTGDLVQRREDGNLLYLGRKDRQVKTRGYRVELDEIEVSLLEFEGIEEAAVYCVPDGQGSNLIQAAVTLKEQARCTTEDLITFLSGKLPPYAVPEEISIEAQFPRTSTGKIDRRKIADMAQSLSSKSIP